jgi:hypothetical protein
MNSNTEGEYNINPEKMEKLVNIYNNTPHSVTDMTLNKMNDINIDNLIKKKQDETDIEKALFNLDPGNKVRPMMTY